MTDEQDRINREFYGALQRLEAEQRNLSREMLDMGKNLSGLIREVSGVKKILWVIAGAILSNLDPQRIQKLLEMVLNGSP